MTAALIKLMRCITRALRRLRLRMRIRHLQKFLGSRDWILYGDALTSALVDAKLAALRLELFVLTQPQKRRG